MICLGMAYRRQLALLAVLLAPPAARAQSQTERAAGGTHFDHVVIIVLENADFRRAIAEPYLRSLRDSGAFLANYTAVAHPSYPNYVALVAGNTFGIESDVQRAILDSSIVASLEAHGLTWKAYAENYGTHTPLCMTASAHGGPYLRLIPIGKVRLLPWWSRPFARKHVPLLSFPAISRDSVRCKNVVDGSEFMRDFNAGVLPNFAFYTPNMRHDGHDTSLHFASHWLANFLGPVLNTPERRRRTLIVVTFDESEGRDQHIYTLLLGDVIRRTSDPTPYTHYDLFRTIEENFHLGRLAADTLARRTIEGVWIDK